MQLSLSIGSKTSCYVQKIRRMVRRIILCHNDLVFLRFSKGIHFLDFASILFTVLT